MPQQRRPSYSTTQRVQMGSGVYLARVISVMDPTFMGKLRVTLLQDQGNSVGEDGQTYTVSYASPFFGNTPYEALGNNNNDFNDTQKSYGMWFVPPDVGVTVLCLFANGNPGEGFWFACVPPAFANQMVPAIGGSANHDLTKADADAFGNLKDANGNTFPLPVGEINKLHNRELQEKNPENIKKPLHPIAQRLLEQGTLLDDVRGTTTTTSRRQVPNSVFGIATPGPLDWRNGSKRMRTGTTQNPSPIDIAVSRLGGTQFVMDDGDDRFQRKTSAADGPQIYADVLAGESGDPTIPYNEYTRLRTRTGHQILMHNSEDLIYITNSRGTAWIELTSNGKIDVYAQDSISIHSEADVNIKADRDINLEAGRNFNAKAISGRVQVESGTDTNLIIGANGKITTGANFDLNVSSNGKITTGANFEIKVSSNGYITTGADYHENIGANRFYSLGGDSHTTLASGKVDHSTPTVRTGSTPATPATPAQPAQPATRLSTYDNPKTNSSLTWATTKFQDGTVTSIMKRVPMHEPWALHENLSPVFVNPNNTDREVGGN